MVLYFVYGVRERIIRAGVRFAYVLYFDIFRRSLNVSRILSAIKNFLTRFKSKRYNATNGADGTVPGNFLHRFRFPFKYCFGHPVKTGTRAKSFRVSQDISALRDLIMVKFTTARDPHSFRYRFVHSIRRTGIDRVFFFSSPPDRVLLFRLKKNIAEPGCYRISRT